MISLLPRLTAGLDGLNWPHRMAMPQLTKRTRCFAVVSLLALLSLMIQAGFAATPTATWTKGHKKILVIPVRFTDAAGPTNSDLYGLTGWNNLTNGSMPAEINDFFLKQSYGQLSVAFTILPVVDLGVPTTYYTNTLPGTPYPKWTEWGGPGSLADDARAKARAVGLTNGQAALYESANYDLDVIALGYVPGQAGAASDGGRTAICFDYFNALPHELCHCFGLQHANGYSRSTFYSPVKSGTYFLMPTAMSIVSWAGKNSPTPPRRRPTAT